MCIPVSAEERAEIRRFEESGRVQQWRDEMVASGRWIACLECGALASKVRRGERATCTRRGAWAVRTTKSRSTSSGH